MKDLVRIGCREQPHVVAEEDKNSVRILGAKSVTKHVLSLLDSLYICRNKCSLGFYFWKKCPAVTV